MVLKRHMPDLFLRTALEGGGFNVVRAGDQETTRGQSAGKGNIGLLLNQRGEIKHLFLIETDKNLLKNVEVGAEADEITLFSVARAEYFCRCCLNLEDFLNVFAGEYRR